MRPRVLRLHGVVVEWLWPSECGGCGKVGQGRLCPGCRAVGLARVPLAVEGVEGAWVLGRFHSPLGHAVQSAKDRSDLQLARAVATLFARRMGHATVACGFDVIVPAPSTPWSRFRRGFALAAVMAEALGQTTGLPVAHVMVRRQGRRQQGLDAGERRLNLAGKIRCEAVPGQRVLLVDDVVTTGSTADACVRELLGAGAREVWVAAACVAL